MVGKIPYAHRKDEIRRVLLAVARQGDRITYAQLGAALGIPTRGPWKPILDELSREETSAGRPDITFMVVLAGTGYPAQIEFKPAKPPSERQKAFADSVFEEIRRCYHARDSSG